MNILITGASGFVGRYVTERLCADGYQVTAVVHNSSAPLPATVHAVAVGDIAFDTDWSEALVGIDAVVHLAARVHVMMDTAVDPLEEFRRVNVAGTERLAQMAVKAGVKRFVFVSSVKVHGEERDIRYRESDPLMPQDNYGISKMEAEQVLRQIESETGLEVTIIRPPLVYGPGVKANFLSMIKVIASGAPLPLASIANTRSMIYVGNLVDAISLCVRHPAAAGRTYLVSDGDDVSTPELIRCTAASLDVPTRLFPFPASLMILAAKLTGKSGAVNRLTGSLTVDSSKIRQELGWVPPCTMEEGLRETAGWFKNR